MGRVMFLISEFETRLLRIAGKQTTFRNKCLLISFYSLAKDFRSTFDDDVNNSKEEKWDQISNIDTCIEQLGKASEQLSIYKKS